MRRRLQNHWAPTAAHFLCRNDKGNCELGRRKRFIRVSSLSGNWRRENVWQATMREQNLFPKSSFPAEPPEDPEICRDAVANVETPFQKPEFREEPHAPC